MNIAKLLEIEGKPSLIIFAHSTGGHTHRDTIDGVTLDGQCISRRYPTEEMPKDDEIQPWLVNHTQDVLGAAIKYRPWHQGKEIHIQAVATSPAKETASAAA